MNDCDRYIPVVKRVTRRLSNPARFHVVALRVRPLERERFARQSALQDQPF
jgi:hypothetical protein